MMLTVAVTRPEPQATTTAKRLLARGYGVVKAPLLVAETVADWGDASGIGAIAITSRSAAMMLADHSAFHGIATYCVGDASAAAAVASGAREVRSAKGDVDALFALLKREATPPIVHLSGGEQRGDLTGRLNADGIAAERRVVYEMAPAASLPHLEEPLHVTLLYSPRTARIYRRLATLSPWREAACVALSEAVAANVPEGVHAFTAKTPTEAALFEALDHMRQSR